MKIGCCVVVFRPLATVAMHAVLNAGDKKRTIHHRCQRVYSQSLTYRYFQQLSLQYPSEVQLVGDFFFFSLAGRK